MKWTELKAYQRLKRHPPSISEASPCVCEPDPDDLTPDLVPSLEKTLTRSDDFDLDDEGAGFESNLRLLPLIALTQKRLISWSTSIRPNNITYLFT